MGSGGFSWILVDLVSLGGFDKFRRFQGVARGLFPIQAKLRVKLWALLRRLVLDPGRLAGSQPGGLEARRLAGSEAWRLGGLESWRLGFD